MALMSLRTTLGKLKDNIHYAQLITKAGIPTPFNVSITRLRIPRRSDCAPDGLDPSLLQGKLKAEMVQWKPAKLDCFSDTVQEGYAQLQDRIILFAHGGAYCVCSPQTHRGITWRLSKYGKAKVLCMILINSDQKRLIIGCHLNSSILPRSTICSLLTFI